MTERKRKLIEHKERWTDTGEEVLLSMDCFGTNFLRAEV